jgi:hypothetical protein
MGSSQAESGRSFCRGTDARGVFPVAGFESNGGVFMNIVAHPHKVRGCTRAGIRARFGLVVLGAVFVAGVVPSGFAESMAAKAAGIIIPRLVVDEAPLREVFTLLRRQSREYDPEHAGVNFVFRFSPAGRRIFRDRALTLDLNRMSLADVIRYTCMAGGLKYRFEDHAVIIFDVGAASGEMVTRAYNVAPGVLDSRRTRKHPKKIDSDFGDDDDDE